MSNATKHSDLLVDDGAIDNAILKLEKFEKVGKKALSSIVDEAKTMQEELEKVSAGTQEGREEIEKSAKAVAKLEKEYDSFNDALSENGKKLAVLRAAKNRANQQARAEAKLILAAEGSYNQLSARYSLVKLRLNEMSKAQRENTKEGKEMVEEAKALREEMNRLQMATGNTALNVGNYTESIKEALEEMNQFPGAAGSVVGATKAMIRQFAILLANPIGAFLGAIAAILVALTGGFLKSEKGAKLLEKATAVFNGVISTTVSLAVKLVESLEEIFEGGILSGIENLGQALWDNIVNRFKAIADLAVLVGRGLKALWEGDMAALEQAALDTGTAMTQLFTGLDREQQQGVVNLIKETAAESEKLTNAWLELAEATRRRREENARLTRSLGEVAKAEAVAQFEANDTTKSYKQQLAALDRLEEAQRKRLQIQIQIARNNFQTINDELKIRREAGEDVIDLLEQQADALAEVQALETEYTVAVLEGEKLRREIRRDAFERSLDFSIDFYDAQKRLLERQANDTNNSFEERRMALQRLVELDKSAFAEQQKAIEDFTGQRLKLNELALEDDERIVRQRLEQYDLDDVTLGRILETLRERKAATQDILELEEALTEERNKQNQVPQELEPFDFGEASENATAKKVSDFANNAFKKGVMDFREEAERNRPPEDIFDLLGIDFGNGSEQIKGALDFAKEQLFAFASFRTKIADQNVANAEREVAAAEAALQRELENQGAGSAARIAAAEDELERAKKTQNEALAEQRKAQRAEERLQTIQQATNLVTASAKIWAQLGFPLALPAIGVMWGSFISSKVRANQLAKRTNRKGTYIDLDWGGSHESGNDIPFGVDHDGKILTAERGEGMAVFTSKARRKYGSFIPTLVNAMNRGEMETRFANSSGHGIGHDTNSTITVNTGNGRMEGYLKTIADNSARREYTDAKGNLIRNYKNERTRIRANN